MKKLSTFLLLCFAASMSAQTIANLSLVYTQVGSEDQSYNTCNYFDKDKIILDSDFGFSKGKDDVCNRNNGGEIDGMVMMKNDVTACSRQSYAFEAGNITITMPVQCKDHGTYTGPSITIDGKTASFGSVTFDNDFDKKDISTTLTVSAGTHDISIDFKGSDKFYFSTVVIAAGGEGGGEGGEGGEGGGDTPTPKPVGDCPEGTTLTLSASNTNWSTTFDVAKQQINFQGDWAGCGWNMSADWTKYNTLVFTFAETLGEGEAITFYVNGDSDPAEVGKIEGGDSCLVVDLSAITTVSSIMFKSAKARILTIACAVLQEESEDTPTAIEQVRPVEIKYMEIYTTMGGRVAAVEGATMPELAPGIYVVRVNGDKQTMKIVR